ncbi:MAG: hypothetical protein MUC50_02905, partial [Myxococcota bacterium]|nr:hypothetical protein [Myxococcota bacterium]
MKRFFLCCLTFLAVPSCSYDFGAIEEEETQEDETQTQKATSSDTATNDDTQGDTGTASDSTSGTASDSTSDTASDSGSGSGSESDVDTTTHEPTVLYLHFWERIHLFKYYQGHELHVGPGSSTNPTKPGWKILADEESMYSPVANDIWARSNPIEFTGNS